ncbi:protein-S-isoprenylcysteine O-methyltransferase [Planctomycetota bacterium]
MFDNICITLYFIGFIIHIVIRIPHSQRYKKIRKNVTDNRMDWLEILLLLIISIGIMHLPLIYAVSAWLDFADYHLPFWISLVFGIAGTILYGIGLWLFWRSHVDLGLNFSPTLQIQAEQTLVTSGVYKYIRHPMYAFVWLWGLAQTLLLQNWIAGPATLACFLPLYFIRVPREEKMMLDHFGDQYRLYMNQAGRVIPRRLTWGKT